MHTLLKEMLVRHTVVWHCIRMCMCRRRGSQSFEVTNRFECRLERLKLRTFLAALYLLVVLTGLLLMKSLKVFPFNTNNSGNS